jgi:hypothetical protein
MAHMSRQIGCDSNIYIDLTNVYQYAATQ